MTAKFQADTQEWDAEIAEVLSAIAIVSKRLAKRILTSQKEKDGSNEDA